jgi:hypothetical protein
MSNRAQHATGRRRPSTPAVAGVDEKRELKGKASTDRWTDMALIERAMIDLVNKRGLDKTC